MHFCYLCLDPSGLGIHTHFRQTLSHLTSLSPIHKTVLIFSGCGWFKYKSHSSKTANVEDKENIIKTAYRKNISDSLLYENKNFDMCCNSNYTRKESIKDEHTNPMTCKVMEKDTTANMLT